MNFHPLALTMRVLAAGAVLLSASLAPVAPAAAEWFADVYVGGSSSVDEDLKISAGGTQRFQDVEFDRSLTYGGRVGKYFTPVPWVGVALDAINYDANADKQTATLRGSGARAQLAPFDITVTAISLDLMLRVPLFATPEMPGGRFAPYVLGGPGVYVARAEDRGNFIKRHQGDADVSLGYHAGAGLAWQFSKPVALIGEYRYSHASPEFDFQNMGNRTVVETELNTHHFLIGLSVRF